MKVSRRAFVSTTVAAAAAHAADFQSQWRSDLTRPWLGPDYWANPMQDWRIRNGRLECFVAGGDRNVFLLTREVSPGKGELTMSVKLGRLEEDRGQLRDGFAGFRTGIKGEFADYRDSAVHGVGHNSGVAHDGSLFIGSVRAGSPQIAIDQPGLQLKLTAQPEGDLYVLVLEALDGAGKKLAEVRRENTPASWIEGGMALVSHSGPNTQNRKNVQRGGTFRFWFRDWTVSGSKVTEHPERAFGPIYFSMHTLSERVLKLTAQLAPLEAGDHEAQLQTQQGAQWKTVATAKMDPMARTATFRVAGWDDSKDTKYRVLFGRRNEAGGRVEHTWEGTVRKDPKQKGKIVVGALTCCNDHGFPHAEITRAMKHFQPDILLFTGDQIYEGVGGYGIQFEPLEQASLDYLRKWLIFGWGFRDLMRDIPTVCMPDDHDVYHGNIWGMAGKAADATGDPEAETMRVQALQDSGGYKMAAPLVNMVQRTQTSHLPDPFDPTPVKQGISVYYTTLNLGGVSLAIIEDRKWKSAPRVTLPFAKIRNGWSQSRDYDGSRDGDVKGLELLGARQMAFLEHWAGDWSGGTFVKVAVSQTLWANLCTLPPPATTDAVTGKLPVLPLGAYAPNEMKVQDHDSNGWPQTPRTNALRILRKAQALHIGGDQHLGSTVQYGLDRWNDGPYVICTPAISNIFPRRWFPPEEGKNRPEGSPRYCGEHKDGFGNLITVHAVANPHQYGAAPAALNDRAVGYGIVEIERATRKITLSNWPRWVDPGAPGAKPYAGWPITIHQFDNGLKTAGFELPKIDAPAANMVLQVEEEGSREVVYTIRMEGKSFVPPVFREGTYTARLIPEKGKAKELRGLRATAKKWV